jgi:glycosyltransferase involved in cell wall biosynthesis
MKLAVDLGAYSLSDGGISRYVGCMLEAMHGAAPLQHDWLLYGRGAPLRRFAGWPGVTVRTDPLPHDAGRIASLATSLPYWSAQDRPDVFWGPAHRLPVWLPKSTASVVTIHDLCWLQAPDTMRGATRWLDATLMPRAIRRADQLIAVSTATAQDLKNAFPQAAHKIAVIAEGVSPLPEPGSFDALQELGIASPFVLFVGTLEPRKNLPRLLDAFAAIHREQRHCPSLVIAGGTGWGGQSLQEKCQALGLQEKVKILGRVDDQLLSTLYRHALCLAMPSLYEGFGLPLVEAMSLGTPVLTSNVSSMPEVAGPAGLLVDPLSVASIEQGLKEMIGNKPFRDAKANAAREQARLFSWSQSAHATLDVLQRAIEQRRSAAP